MSENIHRILFPHIFREVPHRRLLLNILRAIHLICLSIMVGGIYYQQAQQDLYIWIGGVILSGLGLFFIDLYGSLIILFEVRGISIVIKLLLLACLPLINTPQQIPLLMFIIIFSSFISHSPKRLRHKNMLPTALQDKYFTTDKPE